jgi:signal transduction histidine kinase
MTWYRSLYWRVALGVVAFLAAMLVVQAVLFVWAVSQSGRSLPGQSPARLGQTVAVDITSLLERDPQADLAKYVREQYASYAHPFFILMTDGRFITSGSKNFPENLIRMARARLQGPPPRFPRFDGPPPDRPRFDGPPPERPRFDGPPPERPRGRGRGGDQWWQQPDRFVERLERDAAGAQFVRPAPIVVDGRLTGVVVVPAQAPFGFLLQRYAPMLALVGGGVLILGTVLTSVMIFGPARRRLRELEAAARRLGAGDLAARAPEKGGDEIAAVAAAFNTMADDLAARAEALAASDRARRQLLADVSHELNTPVTAVRGYLETLTMPEVQLDEATRARYLGIIGDEASRIEHLIGDLLDLAKFEGGGGTLRHEPVAVDRLFARVAQRHERALEQAGVALHTDIDPDAAVVLGDQDRLEQALQNLAANAIRFAPRGTTIRLTATPASPSKPDHQSDYQSDHQSGYLSDYLSDRGIRVAVEDEGPGIPVEHLPHVFDRFYKADTSRAQTSGERAASGGSGLGLSIVKAIVERHGGRITVASRPGRTVFEIWLPR